MDSIIQNANGTLTVPVNGIPSLFLPTNGLTGYNRANHTGYGNVTLLLNSDTQCSLSTCDLTLAHFDYIPNLGGNIFFAAVFGLLLLLNVFFGFRYKTRGYMIAMVLGLIGEIIGYAGRILLHTNPFDPTGNYFLIYLVPMTIAPAFFAAAIYLCLGRIVIVYGETISRLSARNYTLIFCTFDIISLILQAAGGGISSGAKTQTDLQLGVNVMLGGLGFQVFSLVVFILVCGDFARRVVKSNRKELGAEKATDKLYESKLFKSFLAGLALATLFILIRSAFRVAELSGGFHGPLANNQVEYMILEGAMIIIAATCLTLLHPGICFQGHWNEASFNMFRKVKSNHSIEKDPVSSSREESIDKSSMA